MTWKALLFCSTLGALTLVETGVLAPDDEAGALEAALMGAPVAGRIPSGLARFEGARDATRAALMVEGLDLPGGTELEAWLNPRANRPCRGRPLGSATLGPDGEASWRLDPSEGSSPEAVAGSFVSICTGDTPLVSGNLRVDALPLLPV